MREKTHFLVTLVCLRVINTLDQNVMTRCCRQLDSHAISLPTRHDIHPGEARRSHGDAQQAVELQERLHQE